MSNSLDVVKKKRGVDSYFAEAVDDTLKQVFKEDGARAIYDFLENHSHLKLEESASSPEIFSAALERLMASAAHVVEELILKNFYGRLGLKFEAKPGYDFSDYVRELREE